MDYGIAVLLTGFITAICVLIGVRMRIVARRREKTESLKNRGEQRVYHTHEGSISLKTPPHIEVPTIDYSSDDDIGKRTELERSDYPVHNATEARRSPRISPIPTKPKYEGLSENELDQAYILDQQSWTSAHE